MQMHIDVCNGDADGLCAVVQWRLHDPQDARLVTGLKRDIALLARVVAQRGDQILVCDLSMQRNLQSLKRLLEAGALVRYFDHHKIDDIPQHPLLQAHINVAPDTCTSLLVDEYLGGRFRAWAVVGAFGDNLGGVAGRMAQDLGLSAEDCLRLKSLGESINYNAYGDNDQDVWITPERLYAKLARYSHPLVFLEQETIAQELRDRWALDMQIALAWPPYLQAERASVYMYPDAAWSRRASGSVGNQLAAAHPQQAHALIRPTASGDYVISVRSPLNAPMGAAEFCRLYGGDGRAAAAGIDHLPASRLDAFLAAFAEVHWGPALDRREAS
jgi:hypothetical protein